MQHQAQTLTLYNDGQVPCQFEFIQKLDEPAYCKPWLTANPPKGFVAQGKHSSQMWFIIHNRKVIPAYNGGLKYNGKFRFCCHMTPHWSHFDIAEHFCDDPVYLFIYQSSELRTSPYLIGYNNCSSHLFV